MCAVPTLQPRGEGGAGGICRSGARRSMEAYVTRRRPTHQTTSPAWPNVAYALGVRVEVRADPGRHLRSEPARRGHRHTWCLRPSLISSYPNRRSSEMIDNPILVLAATGGQGGAVTDALLDRGAG